MNEEQLIIRLDSILNRLKKHFAASNRSSDLNVDDMLLKIKSNEVKSSEVDNKMEEIRESKFTSQYLWGRASQKTLGLFISFVTEMWNNAPQVGSYFILNKVNDSSIDDETLKLFTSFLYRQKILETRQNDEIVSQCKLNDVISLITKKEA